MSLADVYRPAWLAAVLELPAKMGLTTLLGQTERDMPPSTASPSATFDLSLATRGVGQAPRNTPTAEAPDSTALNSSIDRMLAAMGLTPVEQTARNTPTIPPPNSATLAAPPDTSSSATLNASLDRMLAKRGLTPVDQAARGAPIAAPNASISSPSDTSSSATLNASLDRMLAKMGLTPVERD